MGQAQLLLVILGVVIIGVAIFVAIGMFQGTATESDRHAVINDLQHFATSAVTYYDKRVGQGGGGQSFVGITIGMVCPGGANANGHYSIESASETACSIVGVGNEMSGSDSVRVRMIVTRERNTIEIIN